MAWAGALQTLSTHTQLGQTVARLFGGSCV